jgi:hypothetical protein
MFSVGSVSRLYSEDEGEELGEARTEGSQSRQTGKYGRESRGTLKQESLCWRGPGAV